MIAISNVDQDLNNLFDRYWDYRWDRKVWSIDKKDRYVLKMFSKEIDDFDIEITWILKISKLEMISTFWRDTEFIEWMREKHEFDKSMSMFSSWFSRKKNSFDADVLNQDMWTSWLDIWVDFETFWLNIEAIEQIEKNDLVADKVDKILKNSRKK